MRGGNFSAALVSDLAASAQEKGGKAAFSSVIALAVERGFVVKFVALDASDADKKRWGGNILLCGVDKVRLGNLSAAVVSQRAASARGKGAEKMKTTMLGKDLRRCPHCR